MKCLIRKSSSLLHVAYRSGSYSNNIFANNFYVEHVGGELTIAFSIATNLATRNKTTNSYLDALEFGEHAGELKAVQVTEGQVYSGVSAAYNRHNPDVVLLRIELAPANTVTYTVTVQDIGSGSIQLNVHPDLAG